MPCRDRRSKRNRRSPAAREAAAREAAVRDAAARDAAARNLLAPDAADATLRPPAAPRAREAFRASTEPRASTADPAEPAAGLFEVSDRVWLIAGLALLLVAAFLRLDRLELAPFHNDEGVNGWFTTNLVRKGVYAYDPANYHGPILYYLALASSILIGLTDVAMRLVAVVASLVTIGFTLALRRDIGTVGSLVAAALLALSPGWLYFARYFIHEELLVAFTVALVYFGLRWSQTRSGQALILAAASAALLFTTKETAILTVGVLVIALACLPIYDRLLGTLRGVSAGSARGRGSRGQPSRPRSLDERVVAYLRDPGNAVTLALAAIVFVAIYVGLYSSFMRNFPKGVTDSFGALAIWTTTGTEDHVHSLFTYVEWLVKDEPAILAVAILGAIIVVRRGLPRFGLYVALWAFGLFAAYSLIGYKTPWLSINFIVPMAILGGIGVDRLWAIWRGRRIAIIAVLGVLLTFSGVQAFRLSFVDYDNDANPYVYAHTNRDIFRLLDDVATAGETLGTGADTHVVILSPDYWPLPWYWRNLPGAGFFGSFVDTSEPIAIVELAQEPTLSASPPCASRGGCLSPAFSAAYVRQSEYTLRPGVQLVLYFRRDAFGL